jgi:serine/threonine-protein kinase
MGTVYKAFDPLIQRTVAVKVVAAQLDEDAEIRERFFAEARAAGRLSHRNIITIYDLGEEMGQPYFAMEFLEGKSLDARMRSAEGMSFERKLELMIQICEGLAYAHERGVIHRDIKPANILVTDSGQAKILDFGLARLPSSELTRTRATLGTISYMSPEQVRGERVDHRADIFSTGVVFYELLTGRKAFDAESFATTLHKILQETPKPPEQIDPTIPREASEIVERALAKPRDERYQHVGEMLLDLTVLRETLRGGELAARPTPPPSEPASGNTPGSNPARRGSGSRRGREGSEPRGSPGRSPSAPPVPVVERPWPPRGLRHPAAIAALIIALGGATFWTAWQFSPGPDRVSPASSDAPRPPSPPANVPATRDQPSAPAPGSPGVPPPPAGATQGEAPSRGAQAAGTSGNRPGDSRGSAGNERRVRDPAERGEKAGGQRDADVALGELTQARVAAEAAGAAQLAVGPYTSARAAEAEGQRLFRQGRFAQAATTLSEASRLFRAAESEARGEQARQQQQEQQRTALQQRVTTAREAYEQSRRTAEQAGASRLAAGVLADGARRAVEAQARADRGDFAGAVSEFEAARVRVEEAQRAALEASRRESTEAAAPPPAAAAADSAAAEQAIRTVLERYETALESRSLPALKRVWPSLGGAQERAIAEEFVNARSIDVQLADARIDLAGDDAAVRCRRRYRIDTTDGHRLQSETATTIALRKSGNTWIIDSVRHDTIR